MVIKHKKSKKASRPFGFGSRVPRFDTLVSHPDLDPQGLFCVRPSGCDPALYHPKPMYLAYENTKKVVKDPWRSKAELEDWCKNLGYRNQAILDQRKWQLSLLGPCWVELPEEVKYYPGVCPNVGFGRTPRFKKHGDNYPGPGTYYQAVPYKAPHGPHSTRPTLDREEPCRFPDKVSRWSLAPNRYDYLKYDDNIENKSKKLVSVRGPYDLFTGKRDGSTIKNHFSDAQKVHATTWPLMLEGSLEGLKSKHTGEWNRTGRDKYPRSRCAATDLPMIPRGEWDPSPASYGVRKDYEFKQYMYGFNSSYDFPPGYVKQVVWPGVGRYRIPRDRPCGIAGQGHGHVFLCKIKRTVGAILPQPMNSF